MNFPMSMWFTRWRCRGGLWPPDPFPCKSIAAWIGRPQGAPTEGNVLIPYVGMPKTGVYKSARQLSCRAFSTGYLLVHPHVRVPSGSRGLRRHGLHIPHFRAVGRPKARSFRRSSFPQQAPSGLAGDPFISPRPLWAQKCPAAKLPGIFNRLSVALRTSCEILFT